MHMHQLTACAPPACVRRARAAAQLLNPASMKQALVEGAERLAHHNMYEQGNGRIDLPASQAILASYQPRASLIPPTIDLADCPYAWPYCTQPLHAHGLPVGLNATVVNGMAATGSFEGPPVFKPTDEGGKLLHVTFQHSEVLWPWSGYLAVYVQVCGAAWARMCLLVHARVHGVAASAARRSAHAPLPAHALAACAWLLASVRARRCRRPPPTSAATPAAPSPSPSRRRRSAAPTAARRSAAR